jgi:hypothetical protein
MKLSLYLGLFLFLFSGRVDAINSFDLVDASTYKVVLIDGKNKDITEILNNLSSNTLVKIKNGTYTASGVKIENNNVRIVGESIDGVKIFISAGKGGLFFRVGKRGPVTDYNTDNLPKYNGTMSQWDENNFSPSVDKYPRYKNINIENITFVLSGKNGSGVGSGIDFYRVDDSGFKIKVKWDTLFDFGNAIRIHYCKNMDIPYVKIDSNKNSVYSMLYYWSYGLKGGEWDIGAAKVLAIDFKHTVNGNLEYLMARGDGKKGNSALSVGYGSINQFFNRIEVENGSVNIKSSVEFDLTKKIKINNLKINNPENVGLNISRVEGLDINNYFIRAKSPLVLSAIPFYLSSKKNGDMSSINLNKKYKYFVIQGEEEKYFEKRPLPILKNSKFGEGLIILTRGAANAILSNVAGGFSDFINKDGDLITFSDKDIKKNGYKENYKTSYSFKNSLPYAVENVDFGKMVVKKDPNVKIKYFIYLSTPVVNSGGVIKVYGNENKINMQRSYNSSFNITEK